MPPPPPRPPAAAQRAAPKPAAAPAKPVEASGRPAPVPAKPAAVSGKPVTAAIPRPGNPGTARQARPPAPPPVAIEEDEEQQPAPPPVSRSYRKEAEATGAARFAVPSLIVNGILALLLIAFVVMWLGATSERKIATVDAERAIAEGKDLNTKYQQAEYRVQLARLDAAKLVVASVFDGMEAARIAGQMRSQGGAPVGFARDLLVSLDPLVTLQVQYLEMANKLVNDSRKKIAETMPGSKLEATAAQLTGICEEMRKQLITSLKGLDDKQADAFAKAREDLKPRLKAVIDDLAQFGKLD